MPPRLEWSGKAETPSILTPDWRLAAIAAADDGTMASRAPESGANHLLHGDNLALLQGLRDSGWAGVVSLVYVDPPFDSGVDYHRTVRHRGRSGSKERQFAYRDVWGTGDYLQFMYERLLVIRDLLHETGSIFVHCDFRRVHHLRCLLDEIFGPDHFRNQIVWAYGGGARGAKAVAGQFPRNHDVILWYGKGHATAYAPIQVERRVPVAEARAVGYRQDDAGNWFKTAPRGDYTDASVARLETEGRIYRTRTGSVRIKYPLRHEGDYVIEDVTVGDVWTDIPDAMHASRRERFDYPTRKPIALLERLILAATRPGDLVLDAFCGSGTTLVAAERHRRPWIGLDVNPVAIEVAARRVQAEAAALGGPVGGTPRPVGIWQTGPVTSGEAKLQVELQRDGDGVLVRLVGYRPALAVEDEKPDWRGWVDAVYVDPAHGGTVFHRRLADVPTRREAQVAGVYAVPANLLGTQVGVQVVDVFGTVCTTVFQVADIHIRSVTGLP
jgi:DNA modification methylase